MPYSELNLITAPTYVFFAGMPLGWTRDGVTIGINEEILTIDDIQQVNGPVDVRLLKKGFQIKFNLAENTLENIKLAIGSNANIAETGDKRYLEFDFSGDLPSGEVVLNTKGPNNIARTWRFYRGKRIIVGEMTLDARNYTVLPITIQIIKPQDSIKPGKVEEEYIPGSPITT